MDFSEYRLVDQVALAVERGNASAVSQVQGRCISKLGPIIEVLVCAHTKPAMEKLLALSTDYHFSRAVESAVSQPLRVVCGSNGKEHWAACRFSPTDEQEWRECLHAFQLQVQQALHGHRKASAAKARICGAVREIVDNIFDHSGAPETGIMALWGTGDGLEISVGDAGVGILASLGSNPKFSYLRDAGSAMAAALKDGNSRYGPTLDRGYGFGTLFRALNSLDAKVRFRSGDYALEIAGRSPELRNPHISQKAELQGFVVGIEIAL